MDSAVSHGAIAGIERHAFCIIFARLVAFRYTLPIPSVEEEAHIAGAYAGRGAPTIVAVRAVRFADGRVHRSVAVVARADPWLCARGEDTSLVAYRLAVQELTVQI